MKKFLFLSFVVVCCPQLLISSTQPDRNRVDCNIKRASKTVKIQISEEDTRTNLLRALERLSEVLKKDRLSNRFVIRWGFIQASMQVGYEAVYNRKAKKLRVKGYDSFGGNESSPRYILTNVTDSMIHKGAKEFPKRRLIQSDSSFSKLVIFGCHYKDLP